MINTIKRYWLIWLLAIILGAVAGTFVGRWSQGNLYKNIDSKRVVIENTKAEIEDIESEGTEAQKP